MNNVKVLKVQPYPFSILVSKVEGVPPLRGQVLKLTEVGLIMRVPGDQFFKVGENLPKVEFDIPTTDVTLVEPVKVMKTWDNLADSGVGLEKVNTVELHFRTITHEKKSAIFEFIKKIGQK